jgi:hypothetical protein
MEMNIDKHALRLSHLSVMQQQRALKALAQKQRAYNKANKANAESSEANTYDWHRTVRLAREARAYNLIRGYLKGIPYKAIEDKLKPSTISPHELLTFIIQPYNMVNNFQEYVKLFDWIEADD